MLVLLMGMVSAIPATGSCSSDIVLGHVAPADQHLPPKGYDHIGTHPGIPDGREGGETVADAFVISELPFTDTGNTCDNVNDYDVECPYDALSPDVVYVWQACFTGAIDVDLCGSSYDTKVFIYENGWSYPDVVACNEDYYYGPPCGVYVSRIDFVRVFTGSIYYIVIDGYGWDCGDYLVSVQEVPGVQVECPGHGLPEGEPELNDFYVDKYNGGCNSTPPVFQTIDWVDTTSACGWLCGTSGWYWDMFDRRDTDWFEVTTAGMEMSFTVDAEFPVDMYVLTPDCQDLQILHQASGVGPLDPVTLAWATSPGEVFWLWVGPTTFSGPVEEFDYVLEVCGHMYETIPVRARSWGSVKAMYGNAARP